MYSAIEEKFSAFPGRRAVAMAMLRYGLRVDKAGRLFCGGIGLSPVKVARAVGCDRRVAIDTAKMIAGDAELFSVFSGLRPTAFVGGAARKLGFGFIEINADPKAVGVVARITGLLAREGVMIRQVVADDPEIHPEPKLAIVTQGRLPPRVIEGLRKIRGVGRISLE